MSPDSGFECRFPWLTTERRQIFGERAAKAAVRNIITADGIIIDRRKMVEKMYSKNDASRYPTIELNPIWISAGQFNSERVAFRLPVRSSF